MPKKQGRTWVEVEVDIDTLFWLFMKAHEEDTTFNKLVNKLFRKYINELETKDKKIASNKHR